jgi:hypothetical protein
LKFWKFQYEGSDALLQCIENRSLPSGIVIIAGLKNTYAHPVKAMKPGDGVVLAKLEGDEGKIFAVGKVRAVATTETPAVVDWVATTMTVYPDARGGLVNWQTKSAFEISQEPAKRYNLQKLIEYYVRSES